MKFYRLHAKALKNTVQIAQEFAKACEEVRGKNEVWNFSLYGITQIGKSAFAKAFANATLQKILLVSEAHTDKMHDYTGVLRKQQVRIGDYASDRGPDGETEPAFHLPRKQRHGGYDILEHAPGDYPYIARIIMANSTRGRDIIMHVDDKLANTPAFQQFTQKFDAKELDLN